MAFLGLGTAKHDGSLSRLCFYLCWLLLIASCAAEYVIVIDAGSTGSRAHLYYSEAPISRFFSQNSALPTITEVTQEDPAAVKPGLSSFANKVSGVGPYIDVLLDHVEKYIPEKARTTTSLAVLGTAGMRRLDAEVQSRIYDELFSYVTTTRPFRLDRENFKTLSGSEEGFFAWLCLNYAMDRLHERRLDKTVGLLELGGGSTQIAFIPQQALKPPSLRQQGWFGRLREEVFVHSYLGYGVAYMEQRHRKMLIDSTLQNSTFANDTVAVPNPCMFGGFVHETSQTVFFEGAGDLSACEAQLTELVQQDAERGLGPLARASERPPLTEDYFAIGLFHHIAHFLSAVISDVTGMMQRPTFLELRQAASKLCGTKWDVVRSSFVGLDPHTSTQQLPARCFDVAYALVLLEKGYLFKDGTRVISYAEDVGGKQIRWSLGYVLSLAMANPQSDASASFDSDIKPSASSVRDELDHTRSGSGELSLSQRRYRDLTYVLCLVVMGTGIVAMWRLFKRRHNYKNRLPYKL
eukprot:GILK01009698.1.p1 GENE.GILK01009698.1~~GILK01009698.1.p1  ORF type:complete len:522 (+),score=88.51 GILK01009698.1:84-1649(+)